MKISLSKNLTDVIGCLTMVGIVAFTFFESRDYPPKSQFFVNICLVMLSILTLFYILQTAVHILKERRAAEKDTEKLIFCNAKILGGILAFSLYVFVLIPYVGFYVSTALFTFGLSYYLGTRQLVPLLILSIAFPTVLFLGFQVGLSIHMPSGFLL